MAHLKILAFENPELRFWTISRFLAFQNPEFKIFGEFKILAFQNTDFTILAFQNPEFKLLAEFKTGEDFGAQGGSKSARMVKLWQFLQGHPKPEFSVKVQRGDQGKFFKNRKKSSPCLKGPKALWRKLNYTLIKMYLKCKDWRRFWREQRLQKWPNDQVMAIFAR